MNNKELVSVIIVCYNEPPEKIEKTINSIKGQTYQNREVIVIDGGSKEITLSSLLEFSSLFSYFTSEKDKGIFDAMNKGIHNSEGEWLIFMNIGDSFFENMTIEKMINAGEPLDDILYGESFYKQRGTSYSPKTLSKLTLFRSGICHQAMMVRRRCFNRIGDFDTNHPIGGDPDWVIRSYVGGLKFKHVGFVSCIYEGGGVSANNLLQKEKRKRLRYKYFNRLERFFFGSVDIIIKIYYRIRSLNFRVPVDWK